MHLALIDRRLRVLDNGRTVAEQNMFFRDLMLTDTDIDFSWIENRLRHLKCQLLYLLAIPNVYAPYYATVIDLGGERFRPHFWVYHAVNGPVERARTLRRYGLPLDPTPNLENLKFAGSLTVSG